MKHKFFIGAMFFIMLGLLTACGGSQSGDDKKFAGKYEDEFGNIFELREDHTATIQFAGQENVNETVWGNGPNGNSPYATITYNDNPFYYFMRDGNLYRYREDMNEGRHAIKIKRIE